jgi:hypothetical protein
MTLWILTDWYHHSWKPAAPISWHKDVGIRLLPNADADLQKLSGAKSQMTGFSILRAGKYQTNLKTGIIYGVHVKVCTEGKVHRKKPNREI